MSPNANDFSLILRLYGYKMGRFKDLKTFLVLFIQWVESTWSLMSFYRQDAKSISSYHSNCITRQTELWARSCGRRGFWAVERHWDRERECARPESPSHLGFLEQLRLLTVLFSCWWRYGAAEAGLAVPGPDRDQGGSRRLSWFLCRLPASLRKQTDFLHLFLLRTPKDKIWRAHAA